jgi:hypothetical protein
MLVSCIEQNVLCHDRALWFGVSICNVNRYFCSCSGLNLTITCTHSVPHLWSHIARSNSFNISLYFMMFFYRSDVPYQWCCPLQSSSVLARSTCGCAAAVARTRSRAAGWPSSPCTPVSLTSWRSSRLTMSLLHALLWFRATARARSLAPLRRTQCGWDARMESELPSHLFNLKIK